MFGCVFEYLPSFVLDSANLIQLSFRAVILSLPKGERSKCEKSETRFLDRCYPPHFEMTPSRVMLNLPACGKDGSQHLNRLIRAILRLISTSLNDQRSASARNDMCMDVPWSFG